jgi:hypothetical protein
MVYTNECKYTGSPETYFISKKTKSFEWGVVWYPKLWHSNGWTHILRRLANLMMGEKTIWYCANL